MADSTATARFKWIMLQTGHLPLRPDGRIDSTVEHRCTAVLIWPDGARPVSDNTVMVDPCFTQAGFNLATTRLKEIGAFFDDIGRIFITHLHGDHMLHLPYSVPSPRFRPFRPGAVEALAGLKTVHCPGHHPLQLALTFTAPDDRAVWVVGDAVLDEEWLRAWNYYWPNGYAPPDVIETWRSVVRIVAGADVIVPGHGAPVAVTADLVRDLLDAFPVAPHADQCPDVADILRARLAQLTGDDDGG